MDTLKPHHKYSLWAKSYAWEGMYDSEFISSHCTERAAWANAPMDDDQYTFEVEKINWRDLKRVLGVKNKQQVCEYFREDAKEA